VPLAHITLATRDVPRTAAFFHEVLGWTPIARRGNIETVAAWLHIAPGLELHLVEVPDFKPSSFEHEYGRHLAVSVPQTAFPGIKERLAAHGAKLIEPLHEAPFGRFFFVDPNGYVFEVIEEQHVKET
jgi:catechol 2,3-dioxygenase-like lactoylglutathione lyase family enzyme